MQGAVANQKIQAAVRQIRRVDARNSAEGHQGGRCVAWPAPARAANGSSRARQPIDGGEGETFRFAVVPAQASEDSQLPAEFLVPTHAESVFERAGPAGGRYIRPLSCLLAELQGLGVRSGTSEIRIPEHPYGAFVPADRLPALDLVRIAAVLKNPAIQARAVRRARLGGARITERPVAGVKLVDPAPRVAAHVRGIIPGAVVHRRPPQKLRARIVAIAVVVEKICQREPP